MLDKNNIPKHIAIIMDGNGRWAKKRHLPRTEGHRVGINRIREIIKAANEFGIKVLTLFAFSTENWQRPKKEVEMLMSNLKRFLKKEIHDLQKNKIRFMFIGRDEPVPKELLAQLKETQELTKDNSGLIVNLAFNYGSRSEIIDATKRLASAILNKSLSIEDITEDSFRVFLYTASLPDPDLLIRTSGEMRLSNFLLWQLSYSELYFTEKLWPDFSKEDLKEAIKEFSLRERRLGDISHK